MSSAMNENHAFARIERRLAREDPELVRRLSAINSQFPDMVDERVTATEERLMDHTEERLTQDGLATDRAAEEHLAEQSEDGGPRRSWTAVIAVVLVAVAVLGLLLTAILSAPGGKQEPLQPHGLAPPPAASD
ncbi:hypothetical protein [Streptomyces sp. TRM70350]|uniref:hypothetical protein n=1 Tax=Streptomyces sp. TRM70350 TaxID=2856165 RepID=UPI001C44E016|nr:hypothetical protein [Streptomyces sp. TRM70350]MBV7697338.1 hypothetical protein [Streptomyces sp. TRM70350]